MDELNPTTQNVYNDSNIITLEGLEHVRRRPGMYIGKLGDGTRWDIIVVGGGITGAGLAREAAVRGLSFCLVDKNDFAFGTSSRSSKR